MTVEEIEELIRKYISTGIAVVVILVAPGAKAGDAALPSGSQVVTVVPGKPAPASNTDTTPAPFSTGADAGAGAGDRTGAGGSDPDVDAPPGATAGSAGTGGGSTGGSGDGSATAGAGPDENSGSTGSGSAGKSGSDQKARSGSGSGSGSGTGTGGNDSAGGSRSGSGSGSGDTAGTTTTGDTASSSTATDGTTAAATLGWGTPDREDDFRAGAGQWGIYDGAGHAGQGRRSPSAVSTTGGVLTLTGDSSGTTAGMAWNPGQKYGRWEGRVKAPAGDPSYNALLLLWPDAEDWPSGGEVDFMEMSDPSRQETNMFLHYGADNQQLNGKVQVDATQWHNWAVEWTPDAITTYVDGKEWYRTTDKSTFPPGPMHLCIQLDWFPHGSGAKDSTMQVEWVRHYPVDGSGPATRNPTGSSSDTGNGNGGNQSGQRTGQQTGDGADNGDGSGHDRSSAVRNVLRRMFSWG